MKLVWIKIVTVKNRRYFFRVYFFFNYITTKSLYQFSFPYYSEKNANKSDCTLTISEKSVNNFRLRLSSRLRSRSPSLCYKVWLLLYLSSEVLLISTTFMFCVSPGDNSLPCSFRRIIPHFSVGMPICSYLPQSGLGL